MKLNGLFVCSTSLLLVLDHDELRIESLERKRERERERESNRKK